MKLVPVTFITEIPLRPPYRAPLYELRLACGHSTTRRLADGPIPKSVRCGTCR
jgi:hypothetical protein